MTSKSDGISDWYDDTEEFSSWSDANVYVYDYSLAEYGEKRVYSNGTALPPISGSIYNPAEDEDGNINWDIVESEDIDPVWAFVRADDFEIKDVVIYMPD